VKLVSIGAMLLLACATSKQGSGTDAPGGDAASTADAPADAPTIASCPDGQFATAIAANGTLTCATIDSATATAVRSRCAVYLGQRDNCTGCGDPPTKWVSTNPLACSPGVGAGNTCVSATLDDAANPVTLAALDLDGDVNGDDKFYTTLHCITAPRQPVPAPCASGWAITGKSGDTWMCSPVSEAAVGYVRSQCAIYFGWRDSCNACTDPPTKWGYANDAGCTNGAGNNDTCTTTTLGGETVNLFGLNTEGDVNDDDKFDWGLYCAPPTGNGGTTKDTCPAGQFVTGTNSDGSIQCGDPASVFSAYVGAHCTFLFGWHDSCDACTQPPTKWGKVTTSACANGTGADSTCTTFTLGSVSLPMFGLNTDGNVNADDTFYLALRCDAL
jgi:hypothetical protein